MKRIRAYGILLLLLTLLLSGCSKESLMDYGVGLLDRMFAGESAGSNTSSAPPPAAPEASPAPAAPEAEEPDYPEAVEPTIPSPAAPEPETPAKTPVEAPSTTSVNVTPSHTDVTFFGPGESFSYLPKGIDGVYACEYASEDGAIASVDSATGKVTAVGPGTTKVTMHVEWNGQYDFECIVRCNWKEDEPQAASGEPALPAEPSAPAAPAAGTISASHTDATFFNPKEHFQFLPVGIDGDYSCAYSTKDAGIATVDEKGTVTAVGPGTTTVSMTIDAGGTEYTFTCIVRCSWS